MVATGSVVALVSVPSFAGVPWIGIATWAGLVCTILACVAISYWVAAVTDEWDIPGAGGYRPLFAALPAVAGGLLLWAGPWALPIIWALLVLPLLAFVRQRDAGGHIGRPAAASHSRRPRPHGRTSL